jgi:hypothetical protein
MDYKGMLDDEIKLLAHRMRSMGNKTIPFFEQALNEDPKLLIVAWVQISAAVYAMFEGLGQFDTWPGNIVYFTRGQRKRKADTDSGKIMRLYNR